MKEIDHEYTREVVCPWCGKEQMDSWEFGDSGDTECGWCEEPYFFERTTTIRYSTSKSEK